MSSGFCVNRGVGQGLVFGPNLFILFINQVCQVLTDSYFTFFADDLAIFGGVGVDETLGKIESACIAFSDWCKNNGLEINYAKTKFMVIRKPQRKMIGKPVLILDNHSIEYVSTFKYLGVTVDGHFSFASHAESVHDKVSATCGAIRKLRRYLNLNMFKLLINAYVFSLIDYCLIVWGQCQISCLESIQNHFHRLLVCFFYPNSSKFYRKSYWKSHYDPLSNTTPAKACHNFFKTVNFNSLVQKVNALDIEERVLYYSSLFVDKLV